MSDFRKVPQKHRIRIGVSSCLLGNPVRYDAIGQHDPFITGTIGRFFELVPVCPEQECGLGVPRETMRLVGEAEHPSLVITCSGADQTERMKSWCRQKIAALDEDTIDGFIFKSKSPSCGTERVKVYPNNQGGEWQRTGTGLFAQAFLDHFPLLPTTDEQKLHNLEMRDNFIEQIFFCRRWRATKEQSMTAKGLVAFHSTNKLQILAHNETNYRALGKLVAHSEKKPISDLFADYELVLMTALREIATHTRHINVLQHILGYFKNMISAPEKQALQASIEEYRQGNAPLIVAITLLNHYANQYQQDFLTQQHYLNPHPTELMLRYHA